MIFSSSKKSEAIHLELRNRIFSGEIGLHDRLPTEAELAQTFKCSVGTVSKAVALLVHDGLVERRQRTGTRVIHNAAVASAVSVEAGAFAFIYPSAQHEASCRLMRGFQSAAKEERRRVVTLEIGVDSQRQTEYLSRLLEFDVCGAVISPFFLTAKDFANFYGILVKCIVPVVLVGTQLQNMDCPAVFFDSFHAGYTSTRHLLDAGVKRIGFLCLEAATTRNYYNGYRWALEERGIAPREDWALRETAMHPNYEHPTDESEVLGARFLERCGDKVDAVICTQDYLAMGVIVAARKAGRKVPQDLKVIGVDGLNCSSDWEVPVTSYRFPFEEAGARSFQMLDAITSGDTASPREVRLRGDIICRASA